MNAKELRTGNLVQTTQGVFKVTKISENEIDICPFLTNEPFTIFINTARPITLTEECLIRFGFYEREFYFDKGSFYLTKNLLTKRTGKKEYLYQAHTKRFQVKYVHQLQNLYFALTGEELVVSDAVS